MPVSHTGSLAYHIRKVYNSLKHISVLESKQSGHNGTMDRKQNKNQNPNHASKVIALEIKQVPIYSMFVYLKMIKLYKHKHTTRLYKYT